ncbi:MAG: hypothetical protein VXZ72_00045 [Chlamydiota bacterium]|nr:hypothetical protein [Chlamydiota bacterium]
MSYSRQELAALGKRASDLHRQQGVDLSDAVVKVASTEPSLTKEHISRITENANLITFEEKFKDSESKHIVFDLADPTKIAEKLSPPSSMVSSEYDFAPSYGATEDVFDHAKEASAYQNHEYLEDQHAMKVAHACQIVESDLNRIDSEAERALYALTHMVKAAALQYGSLYAPLQVIGAVADDEDVFNKVAQVTVSMLPQIPRGEYVEMVPNYNHPLAEQYIRVESLTKEASKYRSGLNNLIRERNKFRSTKRLLGDF